MTDYVTHKPRFRSPMPVQFPDLYEAMRNFDRTAVSGLELPLAELVRTRASQINGCAFCVDMHTRDALKGGETQRRLHNLATWREAPFFTARERAALALTESITLVSETNVPDEVWAEAAAQFDEKELGHLVFLIAAINSWNRISVSLRSQPPAKVAE